MTLRFHCRNGQNRACTYSSDLLSDDRNILLATNAPSLWQPPGALGKILVLGGQSFVGSHIGERGVLSNLRREQLGNRPTIKTRAMSPHGLTRRLLE